MKERIQTLHLTAEVEVGEAELEIPREGLDLRLRQRIARLQQFLDLDGPGSVIEDELEMILRAWVLRRRLARGPEH